MKKSLIVVLLLALLALSACAGEKDVELAATVLAVNENGILVEPDEGTDARASSDKIFFSCENAVLFQAGDRVVIVFDGVIAESYPAQASAKSVELLSSIAIPID